MPVQADRMRSLLQKEVTFLRMTEAELRRVACEVPGDMAIRLDQIANKIQADAEELERETG